MFERARFTRFVVSGGLAALINLLVRSLLSFVVVYELAVTIAYLFGMTAAFLMNRAFVFRRSLSATHVQYARFAVVNIAAFAQVWLISVGLDRRLFPAIGFAWHHETVAHMIGVASPIFTSYVSHKRFSFR